MARDWIILRTAGRSTLPLAASLAEDGFEVWTPKAVQIVSVPRQNFKQEVVYPIIKEFIFAQPQYAAALAALSIDPMSRHARFRVLRDNGGYARCRDDELDFLRHLERKGTPIKKADVAFARGQRVKAVNGIYTGLAGEIVRSKTGMSLVLFDGMGAMRRVEIYTCDLQPVASIVPSIVERAPRHRNAAKYLGLVPNVGKALSEKCEACNDETGREAVSAATRP